MVRGESLLRPFLQRQDGVVTTAQALSAGVTERQLRALIRAGWRQPARGVYVSPTRSTPSAQAFALHSSPARMGRHAR
jgi:hypothetical protein